MIRSQSNWFVRSRLKTRQIVLLLHLDEKRSVVRAAEAAGMTQPAASKLLSELEEAIGVKLFERHARGIEPTWYGDILIRHARAALAEIGRAHDEIMALKSGLTGHAAIGTVVNPGVYLVPPAITAAKKLHPGIRISVELNHSRPLVAKLLEGRLDIVIGRVLDADCERDLDFEPLAEEPHSLVVRTGHPLAKRRNLSLVDLVDQAWVLPPLESLLRPRMNALFQEHGLPIPANVVETSDMPVITGLLRASDAIAPMTEEAVRPYIDTGVLALLPITLDIRMDHFGIVTRRRQVLSPGAEIMLRIIRETAARLYPVRDRARARR